MNQENLDKIRKAALAKKEAEEKKISKLEELNAIRKSNEETFVSGFVRLKISIKSIVKNANIAAKDAGTITCSTNEESTELKNQIRNYIHIFFKAKGLVASGMMNIIFEGFPGKQKVSVIQVTGIGAKSSTENLGEFTIEDLTPEKVEELITAFLVKTIESYT